MKRFLTLLLAAAMVLSFAACGDNGTTIQNEKEEDNVKKRPHCRAVFAGPRREDGGLSRAARHAERE